MTAKGRFRKGKKAFRLGRKNKASIRYERYLKRLEVNRRLAIKVITFSISNAMAMAQIKNIQSQIGIQPLEKATLIANAVIDMHTASAKIWNQSW